jgi:hypothetical protein
MLQTIEAIYDPQKGLLFSESVNINAPIKVLVTFIEQNQFIPPKKGSAQALLTALKTHSLPKLAQLSNADIEAHVAEIAEIWDS